MTLTQINKAGLDELALDHVFTIGASGTDHYTFQGEGLNGTVNDPTLYLTRGKTYRFENGSGSHPIRIQSTAGASGTAYNTGVTNNAGSGTVIVEVQHDAPDVLYYQCTSHANMNGILYITGALADDGVTTAKLANNAVTTAKIATNAVGASELADNAVDTAAIADDAVTGAKIAAQTITGANILDGAISAAELGSDAVTTAKLADGAVNGARIADNAISTAKIADDAVTVDKIQNFGQNQIAGRTASGTGSLQGLSASDVRTMINVADGATNSTSTTINNNADNRVITGSGTANTLNGESNLTVGAQGDLHIKDPGNTAYTNFTGSTDAGLIVGNGTLDSAGVQIRTGTSGSCKINFGDGDGSSSDRSKGFMHYTHSDNSMQIGTNSSERVRIDSSGRVGIGETSPDGDLHIKSSNPAIYLEDSTNSSQHGQAIIEQNGDNLKIRQDAGNASSGSGSNISFQVDAAERVKIANLGDNEYGFKFANSKAIEFKDSNMEICTLTWSINADTWTNFFSGSQNHMSWLFINSIHNSGNSSALWALSDSWSGGSSYATRKIHQNNYSPADIDIQRNGVWWQIRSSYGTYGYAILMVLSGGGSVANLSG